MNDLTQRAWAEQLSSDPDAILLDVRTLEEVQQGHIPGRQAPRYNERRSLYGGS